MARAAPSQGARAQLRRNADVFRAQLARRFWCLMTSYTDPAGQAPLVRHACASGHWGNHHPIPASVNQPSEIENQGQNR